MTLSQKETAPHNAQKNYPVYAFTSQDSVKPTEEGFTFT
jgi:hypothetical protein